jgi:hypothetical protein
MRENYTEEVNNLKDLNKTGGWGRGRGERRRRRRKAGTYIRR